MYKCLCHAVTEKDIEAVMEANNCSRIKALEILYVGSCCGICMEGEDETDIQ